MFYFQTNTLGFTPEFLGRVRLAGSLASLAGVGVYNFGLKEVPLRKMFLWTSLLGATLGMTQVLLITGAGARSALFPDTKGMGVSWRHIHPHKAAFSPRNYMCCIPCAVKGLSSTIGRRCNL